MSTFKAIRPQAGLSLVEVFVALLVLSVGLIALAKLQVDLVRGAGIAAPARRHLLSRRARSKTCVPFLSSRRRSA